APPSRASRSSRRTARSARTTSPAPRSGSTPSPRTTPTPSTRCSRTRRPSCSRSEDPARSTSMTETPPTPAPPKDHGRAGRALKAAVGSAVVLLSAIAASLFFWKPAFMVIVVVAVVVAIWELRRGLSAKGIDIPEEPLMLGGAVMVVVAYLYGAPAL